MGALGGAATTLSSCSRPPTRAGEDPIDAEDDVDADLSRARATLPGLVEVAAVHGVVAGTVPRADLLDWVDRLDRAHGVVAAAWNRAAAPPALVLAPATTEQFHDLLGLTSRDQRSRQVSAVTDGRRIVLNPAAAAVVTPTGRQFVLTHELVHVAVGASLRGRVSLWLSEGYADHVAYAASGLSTAKVAAPLLAEVRAGRGPRALPDEDTLDPDRSTIAGGYLQAWSAVEVMAAEYGEESVRRVHEAASASGLDAAIDATVRARLDQALVDVLGTSRAAFTRLWLARLQSWASS